jgi:oligosaccharide repeat unit polymerase
MERVMNKNKALWMVLSIIAIIISGIMIFNAKESYYYISALLPVCYVIMLSITGICRSFIDTNAPGLSILNVFYYVKSVIYPLISLVSGYRISASNSEITTALLLEFFEIIIIYLTCAICRNIGGKSNPKEYSLYQTSTKNGHVILTLFFMFVFALILIHPSVLYKYNFVTVSSIDIVKARSAEAYDGSFVSVMVTLGKTALTAILCKNLYIKYRDSGRKFYFFLSVLVVCFFTMIVTEVSRSSFVIPSLCGLFLLLRLYPENKKITLGVVGGVLLAGFLVFSVTRFGDSFLNDTLEGTAKSLESYFCGVKNMVVAMRARNNYASEIGFSTFLSDVFGNWMGIGKLFRDTTNINQYFNLTYYGSSVAIDQICPTIGQSLIQFGYLGTYIYTILMSVILIKCDRKYNDSEKIEISYLYLLLAVKCAVTMMGNFKIFMATVLNQFLLLALLFFINEMLVFRGRSR